MISYLRNSAARLKIPLLLYTTIGPQHQLSSILFLVLLQRPNNHPNNPIFDYLGWHHAVFTRATPCPSTRSSLPSFLASHASCQLLPSGRISPTTLVAAASSRPQTRAWSRLLARIASAPRAGEAPYLLSPPTTRVRRALRVSARRRRDLVVFSLFSRTRKCGGQILPLSTLVTR